jgi:hypothetical protein
MNRIRRLTMITAVLGLLLGQWLALSPRPAYACTCAPPGPPAEALAMATAVFAGTVTAVDDPATGPEISSADLMTITFDVSQVWKGDSAETVAIKSPRDSASCGYPFEIGREYLVYVNPWDGQQDAASLCSRTALLADAGDDLTALGRGQVPPAGSGGAANTPNAPAGAPWLAIALVAIALLGAIGLVFFLSRRRSAA